MGCSKKGYKLRDLYTMHEIDYDKIVWFNKV